MGPLASLTLFPPHSLDTSILAAVLVGVVLLALLTETYGWTFVGLVVPGYLASVFVIHPEAGLTVCVEAILTYLLAQALSRGVAHTGAWSQFFGRERFFLIVICSVLVRALTEVVLLPRLGVALDSRFGTTFTLDRSLHSIGLVLVPLTANAFWKLGLRRGAVQVGVPVFATWAVLTFVLLPWTNLSFTSLELTYEDMAQRFLASPKAYIILLTTAILAARFNLRYGWDFNGILVAALVALTWLGPAKLLSTVGEVLVLVTATRLLLKVPGLGTMNLEGPRKTVLVFSLGFLLKFIIGWTLGGELPGLKVSDLFGFGYLVPTLLAVKILQKQLTARVLLPTVHTSLVGVVVGSLIGFPLSLLEPSTALPSAPVVRRAPESLGLTDSTLGVMAHARVTAREGYEGEARIWPRRKHARMYERMWRSAGEWLRTGDSEHLAELREQAWELNIEVLPVDVDAPGGERFAMLERPLADGYRGLGMSVIRGGAQGPVLYVPRPRTEAPSAEAAALLCARVDCRAIVVSGVDFGTHEGDALADEDAPMWRAQRGLGPDSQVTPRVIVRADGSLKRGEAVMHAPAEWLESLRALWPEARHETAEAHDPSVVGDDGITVTLRAHPDDLRELVAPTRERSLELAESSGTNVNGVPVTPAAMLLDAASGGSGDEGLVKPLDRAALLTRLLAWPDSGASTRELLPSELAFLERQVAGPLLGTEGPQGAAEASRAERVAWASRMAALMGLEVTPVIGCQCWLVAEPADQPPRLGALAILSDVTDAAEGANALGAQLALTVPSPLIERGTAPLAAELWRTSGAKALVLGAQGATSMELPRTAFQAFHQAVSRAIPNGGLVAQVRGFTRRAGTKEDLLVTLDQPLFGESAKPPSSAESLWAEGGPLRFLKDRVRYYDAAPEWVGLSSPTPQQAWHRAWGGPDHVTLWFSGEARGAWVPSRALEEALTHAGIATLPLGSAEPRAQLLEGLVADERSETRSRGRAAKQQAQETAALEARLADVKGAFERLLRQRAVHEWRTITLGEQRVGGARVETTVRAFRSDEHGQPWVIVEARSGRSVARGLWFLQQDVAETPPVELLAGDADVAERLEDALWRRVPVVVRGVVEDGKR